MGLRRQKTKRELATASAQAHLAAAKDSLITASQAARSEAKERGTLVADKVAPAAHAARGKAGPVALAARDKATTTTREKVVPAVITAKDVAVEKATPAVETARDKVVDDLLPRLAEAAAAAATAAAAARDNAVDSAQDAARNAVAQLPANKAKQARRRRRFTVLAVLAAAAAAGFAAWKSKQSQDPWTAAPATEGSRVDVVPPATPVEGESLGAVVTEEPVAIVTEESVADELGTPLEEPGANGTGEHASSGGRRAKGSTENE